MEGPSPTKRQRVDPSIDDNPIPLPSTSAVGGPQTGTRASSPSVSQAAPPELSAPAQPPQSPTTEFCLVPLPQADDTVPPYLLARPPHVRRVFPAMPALKFITVSHPIQDKCFLSFPTYGHFLSGGSVQFGCHHETMLTACAIVAYNRAGHLSTSRYCDSGCVPPTFEFLLPPKYYYHPQGVEASEDYPICDDFRKWSFPHDEHPSSWVTNPAIQATMMELEGGDIEGSISSYIKNRDKACLISGFTEYSTTAYVVPKAEERWARKPCIFLAS